MVKKVKAHRCYGRVTTIGITGPVTIVKEHTERINHLPDPETVSSAVALDKMVEMGLKTDTKPRKVK